MFLYYYLLKVKKKNKQSKENYLQNRFEVIIINEYNIKIE